MKNLQILGLKVLHRISSKLFLVNNTKPICEQDPDVASKLIYEELMVDKPTMIARFGATELTCIINYLGVKNKNKNVLSYIFGKSERWWWEDSILKQMQKWSGFFPIAVEKIEQFCELMLRDKQYVDILGSWLSYEKYVNDNMVAKKIHLRFLEPFWSEEPWSRALKGKKILVVHPFSSTILKQYEKREYLFKNKDILPEFKSLIVIKAVQSLGREDDRFKDWFEALEYMKSEINKVDYEICLIGAGAYGFPLAAHVKRQGKKSIHMGGSLQLLFGIRGKRWEDPNYGVLEWGIEPNSYVNQMNRYWIRPSESEKPESAEKVEGACYW